MYLLRGRGEAGPPACACAEHLAPGAQQSDLQTRSREPETCVSTRVRGPLSLAPAPSPVLAGRPSPAPTASASSPRTPAATPFPAGPPGVGLGGSRLRQNRVRARLSQPAPRCVALV